MSEMHLKRAKAHESVAKLQLRKASLAPSSSSSVKTAANDTTESAEKCMEKVQASWKKCLQDSNSVLYYDNESTDGVAGACLKVLESDILALF